MKRFLISLIVFCAFNFYLNAQKVYPDYVDGLIYFKVKTTEPINFNVEKDETIFISEFPFIEKLKDKFGITGLSCPLFLSNNPNLKRYIFVKFDSIQNVDQLIGNLSEVEIVENIGKQPIYQMHWVPNDPYYGTIQNRNLKWYLDMIHAESAWDIARGSSTIKVAVVDNAVWGQHPDLQIPSNLQCNAVTSPATVGNSAPPLSVNQNEVCTDVSSCPAYEWSHGTHCAGLVGAVTNNASGIASMGGGVTLMAVRCTREGDTSLWGQAILRGVDWALRNGAKVISMSYGSTGESFVERDLYKECYDSGVVLLASAGNDALKGNPVKYPAAYPSVIAVASVNSDGRLSSFSEYGTWIDIAAPGGYDVSGGIGESPTRAMFSSTFSPNVQLRTLPEFAGQYYDFMQGTSMSCPLAAGLCGLMLSKNPNLSPDSVKSILQATAQPLAAGSNPIAPNSGIIDAYAAMQRVAATVPNPSFSATPTTGEAGTSVVFTNATAPVPVAISSYKWDFPGGTPSTSTLENPTIIYNTPGIYSVKLVVTNANNQKDSILKENLINISVPAIPADQLATDKTSLTIDFCKSAQGSFNVISNMSWNIVSNMSPGLNITPSSGTGNQIINVVALTENTTLQARMDTIYVTAGSASIQIIITQKKGLPVLRLNTNKISVNPAGGVNTDVKITNSNVVWDVKGLNGQAIPAWLSVTPSSGQSGAYTLSITATPNMVGFDRSAILIVSDTGKIITNQITVSQAKQPVYVVVNPSEVTIGDSGTYADVVVSSSAEWSIYEIPSWAKVEPSEGIGEATVRVTAKSNNTTQNMRSRTLEIRAGSESTTLVVKQTPTSSINTAERPSEMFRIYPNPFVNIVYVENHSNGLIKEVAVLDLTGQLLLKQEIKESSKKIMLDLNAYPQGVYLLKVTMLNGKVQHKKLIKQ